MKILGVYASYLVIHCIDHPRYLEANAGCKHFDVHGGPENIPVSRFSFDAKVYICIMRHYQDAFDILICTCILTHVTV